MTKIYGASDDLVEFEGDVYGEVSAYGTDDEDSKGVLIVCSDGTLLTVKYGKNDDAIWGIQLAKQGTLFEKIDPCSEEDENRKPGPYSDVAYFSPGLKWAYACTAWERVK